MVMNFKAINKISLLFFITVINSSCLNLSSITSAAAVKIDDVNYTRIMSRTPELSYAVTDNCIMNAGNPHSITVIDPASSGYHIRWYIDGIEYPHSYDELSFDPNQETILTGEHVITASLFNVYNSQVIDVTNWYITLSDDCN